MGMTDQEIMVNKSEWIALGLMWVFYSFIFSKFNTCWQKVILVPKLSAHFVHFVHYLLDFLIIDVKL